MNACLSSGSEPAPTALSKKVLTRWAVSLGLTAKPLRVPGTQQVAADVALVPPTYSVRSIKSTLAPPITALRAAEKPATPLPTTMRSNSLPSSHSWRSVLIISERGLSVGSMAQTPNKKSSMSTFTCENMSAPVEVLQPKSLAA